jgi:hypothetical protein
MCETIQVGEGEDASAAPPLLWPLGVNSLGPNPASALSDVRFSLPADKRHRGESRR